jgi:hypothetical protein
MHLKIHQTSYCNTERKKTTREGREVAHIAVLAGAKTDCSTTGKPTRSFATERVSLDSV